MMALRERELLTGFSCDMYAFPYIQKFRVVKLLVKDGKKARIKKSSFKGSESSHFSNAMLCQLSCCEALHCKISPIDLYSRTSLFTRMPANLW